MEDTNRKGTKNNSIAIFSQCARGKTCKRICEPSTEQERDSLQENRSASNRNNKEKQ
jgi:hypothetical protein